MFILKVKEGCARRGALETPHGVIETPVFMSVGTAAAIRGGVSTDDLVQVGSPVELSNTYHLHMQPGEELIARLGGLHKFMHWERPDSYRQRRLSGVFAAQSSQNKGGGRVLYLIS